MVEVSYIPMVTTLKELNTREMIEKEVQHIAEEMMKVTVEAVQRQITQCTWSVHVSLICGSNS